MLHNRLIALVLAASSLAWAQQVPSALTAPCSTLACDVQVDWLRNNGMVYSIADAMPEDKYGFKPTPAQQTFGERVLHVAEVNMLLLGTLGAKVPAPQLDSKPTKKADILAVLKTTTDYGSAVLKELSQKQLEERIKTPQAMAWFMGPEVSRMRIVYFLMTHAQDTYGQLVVYMRLNGIVPPLSRQP